MDTFSCCFPLTAPQLYSRESKCTIFVLLGSCRDNLRPRRWRRCRDTFIKQRNHNNNEVTQEFPLLTPFFFCSWSRAIFLKKNLPFAQFFRAWKQANCSKLWAQLILLEGNSQVYHICMHPPFIRNLLDTFCARHRYLARNDKAVYVVTPFFKHNQPKSDFYQHRNEK